MGTAQPGEIDGVPCDLCGSGRDATGCTNPDCSNAVRVRGDPTTEIDVTHHSSSLERIVELAFLSELTQEAWFARRQLVDVMHSSVDAFGHDVVLECGSVLRHVQLKARRLSGTTVRYKINTRLAERPSGCVIWIGYARNRETNRIEMEYRWFGGGPGERLPDLGDMVARHTKANAQGRKAARPAIRVLTLTRFNRVGGIADLLDRLFGPVR